MRPIGLRRRALVEGPRRGYGSWSSQGVRLSAGRESVKEDTYDGCNARPEMERDIVVVGCGPTQDRIFALMNAFLVRRIATRLIWYLTFSYHQRSFVCWIGIKVDNVCARSQNSNNSRDWSVLTLKTQLDLELSTLPPGLLSNRVPY